MSLTPLVKNGFKLNTDDGQYGLSISAMTNEEGLNLFNYIVNNHVNLGKLGIKLGAYASSWEHLAQAETILAAVRMPPNSNTLRIENYIEVSNGTNTIAIDSITPQITINGVPIGGGGGSQGLQSVLSIGNDAVGQSITGVNDIQLSTINGSGYTPFYVPDINAVLAAGPNAYSPLYMNNYDIYGVNNLYCVTLNGMTPTTIGLTWSNLTGTMAYGNLPNTAYEVYNYPNTTSQRYDRFNVNDTSTNSNAYLTTYSLNFEDGYSGTTTTYGSNNISSNNGTNFTITAGPGGSTNLNLNCSQLVINGTPYNPTSIKRFNSSSSYSFGIGSGNWYNVGIGSSPIYYISGLDAYAYYTVSINFTCTTNSFENTGSMYLGYTNGQGSWPGGCITNGRPAAGFGDNNKFGIGSTTQFVFNDYVYFQADASGQLAIDMYFGHNGGSWSGDYQWSINGFVITP